MRWAGPGGGQVLRPHAEDRPLAARGDELDPQIAMQYRDAFSSVEDKLVIGLGNDEIGYQVQPEKFDPSCNACAPFILAGVPQLCPVPNPDCSTVFQNNVGIELDPVISGAVMQATQEVNQSKP